MSTNIKPANTQGDAMGRNLLALKKRSFEIKFELDDTDYISIENIGSGAYGVVCSAIHRKTKEKVAIKKTPNIFQHLQLATRTYREIKILRHFNHENIISIREILTPNMDDIKDVYIVLDLMESDLHQIIHTHQPLTNEHACFFLYQILRGLKYIHSANVIHRDLKPSNLLINADCDLKIGDFGMARGFSSCVNDTTEISMTQYVATRWYRAPELILSVVDYTAAVDVWSVGCIFAEMLGRKQLFPGSGQMNQLTRIVQKLGPPTDTFLSKCRNSDICKNLVAGIENKGPVPLQLLYPKASKKARDLLGQMLALDPDDRITVEAALKHPYLRKYHDPSDEPCCIPAFNFDFEKERMSQEALREAILKEIKSTENISKVSKTYNIKLVPKEELTYTTPVKSHENSAITPRTAAAIQQIQEIAKQKEAESETLSEGVSEEHSTVLRNNQLVPQAPIKIECTAPLKVDSDKFTDDVEMISAKSRDLKIGSPTPDKLLETAITQQADVKTLLPITVPSGLPQRLSDVDMPSAKTENDKLIEKQQETFAKEAIDPLMDAKARLKANILNGRKPHSVSERGDAKPRITAFQRQKEREDRRRKKLERANQRKKKQEKDNKSEFFLSNEDRNMLERWKSMQQSTKPFVHPIRSHMKDITLLRHAEAATIPSLTQQPGLNVPAESICKPLSEKPSQPLQRFQEMSSRITGVPPLAPSHAELVVGASAVTVYNTTNNGILHAPSNHCINQTLDGGLHGSNVVASSNLTRNSQRRHIKSHIESAHPQINTGIPKQEMRGMPITKATSTLGCGIGPVVGSIQQLPEAPGSAIDITPLSVPLPQHLTTDFQQGGAFSQCRIIGQPRQAVVQPLMGRKSQQVCVSGVSSTESVTTTQINIQPQSVSLTSQHSEPIDSSLPQASNNNIDTWTIKLNNASTDNTLLGSSVIDTAVTTTAPVNLNSVISFTDPNQRVKNQQQPWPPVIPDHDSMLERLPSYTEAIESKTLSTSVPFFSQISVDGRLESGIFNQISVSNTARSLTDSNEQQLPKHAVDGVTLSLALSGELINNSTNNEAWSVQTENEKAHLRNLIKSDNTLKVTTLTKMLHKSHVDDLTLAETPKGTGGGYGVGLDLDSLLLETLPMEADQQSPQVQSAMSAPPSAPLSASLIADWQEASDMNQGELEALTRDFEMGFPSPPIADVTK